MKLVSFLLLLSSVLLESHAVIAQLQPNLQPKLLWQTEPGIELENLAVRNSGELLLTAVGSASLWQYDPLTSGEAKEVAIIPGVNSLFGIGEIAQDIFVVAAGNYSRATSAVPQSFSVWAINLRHLGYVVSKVLDLPSARFLNGLTTIPPCQPSRNATILLADTVLGQIYHIDPTSGSLVTTLSSNSTDPNRLAALQSGVNGVRFHKPTNTLYYTNTILGQFGYVELAMDCSDPASSDTTSISLTGNQRTLATSLRGDDFALARDGSAYISGNPVNTFFTVARSGEVKSVVGGQNSTVLIGPTSAAFGRTEHDYKSLYITSTGLQVGVNGTTTGGKLFKLDGGFRSWYWT